MLILLLQASASGKVLKAEDLSELAKNTNFLNSLQSGVVQWVKDIQKVTKLERIDIMPTNSDTATEVRFWLELEVELNSIDKQLRSTEADVTLNTLRQARRFFATAPFDTDTIGLKKLIETVSSYKQFMKEFPINELLTASEMTKLANATRSVFEHLRKSKAVNYPIARYLRLVEAISRDMCSKVLEILKSNQFMSLSYNDFERITSECRALFTQWDEMFNKLREVLREIGRRRRQAEEDLPLVVNVQNKVLMERIAELRKFRHQHEELRNVISRVLPPTSTFDALSEMDKSYESVRVLDPLVFSTEGTDNWRRGVKDYEDRIERVETHIKEQLRERLAAAKNATEMFRVFSKYNALFFRPRVRSAISEYQNQLITRVKEDIQRLHERFKSKYAESQDFQVAEMRDIPPVSGAIIWARQIERQLKTYMKRVEDVLGKNWALDPEGRKLKDDYDNFRAKLNTDAIFDRWVQETQLRRFEISGRLLDVNKKGNNYRLEVNFDHQIITLFKEVRNLQWLGYQTPFSIGLLSSGGRQVYPFAVSLQEIVRTYSQTASKITSDIALLVAKHKRDAQLLISEGFRLRWENLPKLDAYVSKFSAAVAALQDKVDDVLTKYETIKVALEGLRTCQFNLTELKTHIDAIQNTIDQLNLAACSNLEEWTHNLTKSVEAILLDRLAKAIHVWVATFEGSAVQETAKDTKKARGGSDRGIVIRKKNLVREAAPKADAAFDDKTKPKIVGTAHEIIIRNQVMQLDPPLELARASLFTQFNQWLGSEKSYFICMLSCLF
jgi:dynein heavy chain 1